MKRLILFSICCLAGIFMANAQKFALIDMEYIMENIPAYQRANNELQLASQQYQKAIEAKMKEAETLYTAYQKASATLSAAQRTQKEEAIIAKETEAKELKRKYFGNDGELYKKRESLMRPIQDEIYNAIKEIAEKEGYMRVDDRASSPSILFANPSVDISDDVLSKLGYAK